MSIINILLIIILSPIAIFSGILTLMILYGIVYCLVEVLVNAVKEAKSKLEDKSG